MIHPERRRENLKKIEKMDREKVIKWLDVCKTADRPVGLKEDYPCRECPYIDSSRCMRELVADALAMLKEQEETIDTLYSILNDVCKDVREETEGDHVCGLCEYDVAHKTDSGDWAGECPGFESADCFCMKNEIRKLCGKELI